MTTQHTAPALFALVVRDYGQGVPESELANIFQPFYRVADDRNRQSGGTGLGLAIADRVVRIHGGTICARNVHPAWPRGRNPLTSGALQCRNIYLTLPLRRNRMEGRRVYTAI